MIGNHAVTFDQSQGQTVARCACGWTARFATQILAVTGHNAHLTTRGITVRTYV